jgi:hypothetical protein
MITFDEPTARRLFQKRTTPMDAGVKVTIAGKDTTEDEVYIEASSDAMIIYTGERARAMRRGERPAKMPKAALPVRAAATAQSAADPGDASPLLREMKATTVDEDDAEVAKLPSVREPGHPDYVPPSVAEQVELERAAARARGDAMQTVTVSGADDELDTLPPTSTSRPPKAPRDRTRAQQNALRINTTMQTSLGNSHVELDLTPQIRSMSH